MRKIFPLGFAFAVLIFAAFTIVFQSSTGRLLDSVHRGTRSFDLIEKIEVLKDRVVEAEHARREFVLSGSAADLRHYRETAGLIQSDFQDLRQIRGLPKSQLERLDRLEPLIGAQLKNMNDSVEGRINRGYLAGEQSRPSVQGGALQARITQIIGQMMREERTLFKGLSGESQSVISGISRVLLAGSMLTFVLFFLIFFFLSREIGERKRAEELSAALAKSVREELSRTALLKDVAAAASSSLEISEITRRVLREANKHLKASAGSIYFLDEKERALKHLALFGYPEEARELLASIPLDEDAVMSTVIRERLPILTHDSPLPPGSRERVRKSGQADSRWFGLPIYVRNRPVGTFSLSFTEKRPFTEDEVSIFRSIAEQLGVAMENAILFQSRREAEDRLRQLTRQYGLILKSAGEGVFGLDASGNQTFINEAAARMLGYTPQELIGKHSHSTWHHTKPNGEAYPKEECPIYAAYKDGTVHTGQELFWRKNGTSFWAEYNSTPIHEGEEILGAVVTFRDITERRRAEDALRESEERFKGIFAKSPIAIGVYDSRARMVDANEACLEIFGIQRPDEIIGSDLFSNPNLPEEAALKLKNREIVKMEGPYDFEKVTFKTSKSGTIWLSALFTPLMADGRIEGYLVQLQDITERKEAADALQKANESLSRWLSELEQRNREIEVFSTMISLLQACARAEEAYAVVNNSSRELFPGDSGAVYITDASRSMLESVSNWGEARPGEQVISPGDCWALRLGRAYLADGSRPESLCPHVKHKMETATFCMPMTAQGEALGLFHLELDSLRPEMPEDVRERLKGSRERLAAAVSQEIALSIANFRLRESLFEQSIRDPLTGLFNRRYMNELLEKELHRSARKGNPLGVIMLDIDFFKRFNDTYGHEAGDILLRELGGFLKAHIRGEDFACRYGGEEFVIIMPDASLESASERAGELLKDARGLTARYGGKELGPVTLSLGVAAFPRHGLTAGELMRAADSALYRAKAEGRDRVVSIG